MHAYHQHGVQFHPAIVMLPLHVDLACHHQYGTLVLTRLWYIVTGARTVVVCPEWIDKLAILILGQPQIVLCYEMPPCGVVTDIGLYHLVLGCWIEDKSSVLHKLL